jgi:hypothetical protein
MSVSAFPFRMLYATTDRQREAAREIGCNWALVYTHAHRENDFPIFFESEPRIARLRRQQVRGVVESERRLLRHSVDHAHRLGLKAMIHSYELSLPPETREVYPRLYRPELKEYRAASREARATRMPCLADARVREMVSLKVAEVVRAAPELDAYSFSFNECLSLTKVRHRCDLCRDIPFHQIMAWLADAVREGVRSVNPRIRVFHRLWGVNEHDDASYVNLKRQLAFTGTALAKEWLPGYLKAYAPAAMQYKPSRDLPRYFALQRGNDLGFIAKGTWADISLEHPLNPWLPSLRGHDALVELSWEQTVASAESFHLIARQIQKMARYARASGCNGLAGIPCQWGYKEQHHGPDKGALQESYHQLGLLHLDVFEAVLRDPDVDLVRVLDRALRRRYGRALPPVLVRHLLDSQSIKARSVNIRGIRGTGDTLEEMFYQLMRYAPTFPDWRRRLARTPENVRRVLRENDSNIAHAARILADIDALKPKLPARAFEAFKASFSCLHRQTVASGNRRAYLFMLWALKEGRLAFSLSTIRVMEHLLGFRKSED